jgi:hypothetical protein
MKKTEPVNNEKIMINQLLYEKTQPIIRRLEGELNGSVISYWISPNGSVCHNDVNVFHEILENVGNCENIFLFIKSDGGNGKASLRMVNLLRNKCKKLQALVPLNCESAATMLALGADVIQMGPMAFLTPVDTSVRHDLSPVDKDNDRVSIGTNELERIIAGWKNELTDKDDNVYKYLFNHIHPLAIAAVDRAGSLSNMLCNEIMSYHIKDEKKRLKISKTLNSDYPSHGYPIVLKEAQRIGINAIKMDEGINKILIELNEIYSEVCKKNRKDFTPHHHKDNEILNIIECNGKVIYYELDKEWHYSETERTWRSTNEKSSYRMHHKIKDKTINVPFHVR